MRDLALAQASRFEALDPLLPPGAEPPAGEEITATLPDGRTVTGVVYRATYGAASVETLWETRVVWEFTPMLGDTGRAGMDAALGALCSWLARTAPEATAERDTAVRVLWPSRDVAVSPALRAHGFVPLTVLAVRTSKPYAAAHPIADVTVRRATTADLEELIELELTELRYSTEVTGAVPRDNAESLLAAPLRRALLFGGRVLIADQDGVAAGVASCGWSAPIPGSSIERLLPEGRWGYVGTLSVAPAFRGVGIGRALMAAAHKELLVDGVRGTYLYYDLANPLSSVFWPRQGYRPLWTKWTVRPMSGLR